MSGTDEPESASGGRLYKRVADELRAAILAGRYPAGRRLPAERELAEQFNVSRPTIREAVIAVPVQSVSSASIFCPCSHVPLTLRACYTSQSEAKSEPIEQQSCPTFRARLLA